MSTVDELAARPLSTLPIAVLDFETTGLSAASGDRVVEVAVARYEPGAERARPTTLSSLVHPEVPIPGRARAIHGITDRMVAGAPRFAALLPELRQMLDGAVLVAHNARFDLSFLQTESARAGDVCETGPVIDTLALARRVFGQPRCGLAALAELVGATHTPTHRALADALATWEVLSRMLTALDPDWGCSTAELSQMTVAGRAGGPARTALARLLKDAARTGRSVVIDYASQSAGPALLTRRRIDVLRWRPPSVEAFCHLRHEERSFRLRRIVRAWPDDAAPRPPRPRDAALPLSG